MTRTYALKRLLEHGPLTFLQIRQITGWETKTAWSAVFNLMKSGVATYYGEKGKSIYALTGDLV